MITSDCHTCMGNISTINFHSTYLSDIHLLNYLTLGVNKKEHLLHGYNGITNKISGDTSLSLIFKILYLAGYILTLSINNLKIIDDRLQKNIR